MPVSIFAPAASGYGFANYAQSARQTKLGSDEKSGTSPDPLAKPLTEQAVTGVDEAATRRPVDPDQATQPSDQQQHHEPRQAEGPLGEPRLTPKQQAQVRELAQRDVEVKAHEQAHVAAGGRYVRGGASYEYQTGPDGKRYAVGGEVAIDTSKASTPEATITKAQTIRRAATAPAQPSGQDRAVAAKAGQLEREARAEIAEQQREQAETAGAMAEHTADAQSGASSADSAEDHGAPGTTSSDSQRPAPPPISVRLNPLNLEV